MVENQACVILLLSLKKTHNRFVFVVQNKIACQLQFKTMANALVYIKSSELNQEYFILFITEKPSCNFKIKVSKYTRN